MQGGTRLVTLGADDDTILIDLVSAHVLFLEVNPATRAEEGALLKALDLLEVGRRGGRQ